MSNHIKAEIVRLMREEFDPCPPNYGGHSWHDCAEEVADSIVALFASPQTDLLSRAEVLRVIRSLGAQDADLAMYGAADNARAREYGEAAATRACCAIALMPAASPSPAPAAVEELVARLVRFANAEDSGGCVELQMQTSPCREAATTLSTLAAEVQSMKSDREYVIGFNAGWDEALAQANPAFTSPAAVDVEGLVARLVKPLEWKFFPQGFPPCWCAQTPFGDCVVEEEAGSDGPSYAARGTRMNVVARTEGLPEAKAAAQADYAARIMSALDASALAAAAEREAELLRLATEHLQARHFAEAKAHNAHLAIIEERKLADAAAEREAALVERNTFLEQTRGCDMNDFVQMGMARDEAEARVTAAEAERDRLRQLVCDIAPYIDSIVCYASTVDEYLPNRIARDVNAEAARAAIRKETA